MSSASALCLSALWAVASLPARSTRRPAFGANDNRTGPAPASRRRRARPTAPIVDLLASIGALKHANPAQIALAWLLARKPGRLFRSPALPSSAASTRNIRAAAITLTPDDLRHIEQAAAQIAVQGDRYPKAEAKRTSALAPIKLQERHS